MNEFARLKEKTGLENVDLAEKLGISVRTVYRYEKGEIKPKAPVMKELKNIARLYSENLNISHEKSFRYIDLFAGIGGFRKAFDSVGGECVFTSEWDKSCRATYQANNHCNHEVVGDIREYTQDNESLDLIPEHDLLVAGFPCQPFSIAGVSKKNALGRPHGFKCDTQGTLFFDLAQIIEHHQPQAILLENVKNLVSHDKKKTFKVIHRTLTEELGYHITWKVLDAKFWVPQHRERIFIVGFRKENDFSFDDLHIPELLPGLSTVLHQPDEMEEPPYFVDGKVGDKYTLTPKLWQYLQDYREKHRAKGNGFGFSLFGPEDTTTRTLSARYYKDGSEILIEQKNKRPRRLTPRECARLMGFDKPGESNFHIPVSDTQAYKQFGNSVVVPLATAVASLMKKYITDKNYRKTSQLSLEFDKTEKVLA